MIDKDGRGSPRATCQQTYVQWIIGESELANYRRVISSKDFNDVYPVAQSGEYTPLNCVVIIGQEDRYQEMSADTYLGAAFLFQNQNGKKRIIKTESALDKQKPRSIEDVVWVLLEERTRK